MNVAGEEWGVTKKQLDFEFKEFNIKDMLNDINKCEQCKNGLSCMVHKYVRKHEFIERRVTEKKPKPKKIMLINDELYVGDKKWQDMHPSINMSETPTRPFKSQGAVRIRSVKKNVSLSVKKTGHAVS